MGNDKEETADGTALLTSLRTISEAFDSALFVVILTYATNIKAPNLVANSFGVDISFFGITLVACIQLVISIIFVDKNRKKQKKV